MTIRELLDFLGLEISDSQFEDAIKWLQIFLQRTAIFFANIQKLPEKVREALLILGDKGWFPATEVSLPSLWELQRMLEKGRVDDTEQVLMQHFRERLNDIAETLKTDYPRRAAIINAAFNAHKRGEYSLSVPVFLIQAEGICQDLTNCPLYGKKNHIPVIAEYVQKISEPDSLFLYPLTQLLPITASRKERGSNFKGLNRHQVLHGESVDYGTEKNSFKAISLLTYIANMLKNNSE